MSEVLLAGVSMRAAAVSASRAGFNTFTVDAFADFDLPSRGTAILGLTRGTGSFEPREACRAARDTLASTVVYGSGFEHDPAAVARIAAGRTLWGNSPAVLRRVRSPQRLFARLARRGFAVPRIITAEDGMSPRPDRAWLEKPIRSGGGRDVRRWVRGSALHGGFYLEELIEGAPGSIVFVGAERRAVALCISRQLTGEAAFGASGYRYCGSILSHPADLFDRGVSVAVTAHALALAIARDYSLVGLNCVDFIARDGIAVPLEVNPRWSASMELVERAHGVSMFGLHALACSRGELPVDRATLCLRRAVGKAIVFARTTVDVGDTRAWLSRADVADVPRPGGIIRAGEPICTVFADGADAATCHRALIRKAESIYELVERRR